jgi:hypothetical protein
MRSSRLLPGFILFSIVSLLLLRLPGVLSAAYLNGASHELVQSMVDAPFRFPYALEARALAHARHSMELAERGQSLEPASGRLACLRLRAAMAAMDWQAAWVISRTTPCDDVSLYVQRAPWEAIQVIEYLQRGEYAAARAQFRWALVEGSGLLAPSFESFLKPSSNLPVPRPLQKDAPRFVVGTKTNYQWQPAPQPVSESWALVGYDVDEAALETGERVNIALFWKPLQSDAMPDNDWIQVGALWRQEARLVNLIPDSGFEWAGDGVSAWGLPEAAAQVVLTVRAGRGTRALEILPNPKGGGAIAATRVLPLGVHCAYLMGGWVRSQGAAPTFSIVWDGLRNDPDNPPHINLMEGPRDLEWMHVSTVVQPKPGARGVMVFASNWAALWLQGLRPPYAMMVDNVFLIPISLPNSPRCVLNER